MLPIMIQGMPEKVGNLDPEGKDWRRALKYAFFTIARLWRDKFLPRHFTPGAKGKYLYAPRTRGYLIRKMNQARVGNVREGGLVDLVYTGELRDRALSTVKITATAEGATATLYGPKYLYVTPKKRADPDKAKEILTMAEDELNEEDRLAESIVNKEFYAPG